MSQKRAVFPFHLPKTIPFTSKDSEFHPFPDFLAGLIPLSSKFFLKKTASILDKTASLSQTPRRTL